MIFKSGKKRPVDVFSDIRNPHLEEAYVKFPGKKLKCISKKRGSEYVRLNRPLLEKIQKKHGRKYTHIHTHPEEILMPSHFDLINFLALKDREAAVIVPLGSEDNKPKGYFVMKKSKHYKFSEADDVGLEAAIQPYIHSVLSGHLKDAASKLKSLAKKYNFSYRFIPVEGVALSEEAQGFKSSRQSLETKLAIVSFTFISLSILFSLSSITGNVLLEHSPMTSNAINMGLFIAGIFFTGSIFFLIWTPKYFKLIIQKIWR